MKQFALLSTVGFALLSACADSATSPAPLAASAPQFVIVADNAPPGANFRKGSGDPVCTISGITVSCGGTQISGVGNADADVSLTVQYAGTVQCRNHGGQIVDVKTQSTSSTPAPDATTELRNGTLVVSTFAASTVPSDADFEALAVCPNGNWTKELLGTATVLSFTYTLTFDGFTNPAIIVTGP
jgi:hypothetical protein